MRKAARNLGSPMPMTIRNEELGIRNVKKKFSAPASSLLSPDSRKSTPLIVPPLPKTPAPPQQTQIFIPDEDESEPEIIFMGQNSGGYLVYDNYDGLVLMDPHAAHERINYEKIETLTKKSRHVQKLLTPILLHPTLALEVHEFEHALKESGFGFEDTPSGTELKSVPAIGAEFQPEVLLRASLAALRGHNDGDTLNILWRTWATMACKASLKLTTKIPREEALSLWKNLHDCQQPFVCPHGRPTLINIKNFDLKKQFGRD
ncbi:MAG: hypothetical protein IJU31_06410 [Synergistaceae bacterium]|nr:hypothetical protein [Synergistaceae bacterium]